MKNKPHFYQRKSIRLKEYDYSTPGEYFVTICIHDKQCILGEVVDEEIRLSREGEIAKECWIGIQGHFHNVELDTFIIMPNHVHGIIILNEPIVVGTRHAVSLQKAEQFGKPTCGSIPTIIRSFKSAATKRINELHGTPRVSIWQPRYYEHIIRDDKDLNNIRDYIANNPMKWLEDEENMQ